MSREAQSQEAGQGAAQGGHGLRFFAASRASPSGIGKLARWLRVPFDPVRGDASNADARLPDLWGRMPGVGSVYSAPGPGLLAPVDD